jgi:hypothetical protein
MIGGVMKRTVLLLTILSLLLIVIPVAAGNIGGPKAIYVQWSEAGGLSDAYLMKTPSGVIHAQLINNGNPIFQNAHAIYKPNSVFPNATECDAGAIYANPSWSPVDAHNAMLLAYKDVYAEVFDLGETYLDCIYPMGD